MLRVKDIYMRMCLSSTELHVLTSEERQALQAHLRLMYKNIEEVCERHGLTIMLAYGSLLGAVRHGGFIPWDDDLDVYMPREDYDRLINVYADELPSNYIVYAPNSKNGPTYQFAKIIDKSTTFIAPGEENSKAFKGVFVDIFPLENISNSPFRNKCFSVISKIGIGISASVTQYEQKSKIYRKLMSGSFAALVTYWIRQIIGFLFSFASSKTWYNLLDKLFQQKKETSFLHEPSGIYTWEPISKDHFFPIQRVKFDDIEVNIPSNPYFFLERDYGDWNYIPKPEERWSHFLLKIVI